MIANPNFPANLDIKPSVSFLPAGKSDVRLFGTAAQRNAIQKFGIAGRVWEAAYLLSTYIQAPRDVLFDPPFLLRDDFSGPLTILELGSGTGIVAAACADQLIGQDTTLIVTDLPEVCPLLEQNLQEYLPPATCASAPKVLVRPLTWGSDLEANNIAAELGSHRSILPTSPSARCLTHVICSDLSLLRYFLGVRRRKYGEELDHLALGIPINPADKITLLKITAPPFTPTSPSQSPRVIVSYKVRSLAKETPFWSAFGLWFSFQPVLAKKRRVSQESNDSSNVLRNVDNMVHVNQTLEEAWTRFGSADENDLFIFVASRRPESLTWEVPHSDQELLAGVGAWGSQTSKGDDTFEGLLLMGLDVDI
ncbi:hypothetical protein NM688_g2960 [Phlebia brevispora]|uniref:Uncharacterized protein n=1 Tax=Phlebia brevispora TaxID=194682 RepID=A0ACC1T756_9APHY|nr:hypothetical protein NM688_g2960 [Phlebia brevispora]